MKDPIELYRYPEDWIIREAEELGREEVKRRIESGLYILTHKGWLRRGLTTGTTASASAKGAIASLYGDVEKVSVWTPAGIYVEVEVNAEKGRALARKFSGDHEFDVTDGIEIHAEVWHGLEFGVGVGKLEGKPAISESALFQLERNIQECREKYGYNGSVRIWIPKGEKVAEKTGNRRLGIEGGISLLGTTGFVEPWCEELVEAKIRIAENYEKVVLTTGRKGWRWAFDNLKDYQPFVFGVHFERALKELDSEIIIAGLPSLLIKWANPSLRGKILKGVKPEKFRKEILEKAKKINERVVDVILIGEDSAMDV